MMTNNAGNTIVSMECVHGVVKAYVNAVHGVRSDNVKPYGCLGEVNEIKLGMDNGQIIPQIFSSERNGGGKKPVFYYIGR